GIGGLGVHLTPTTKGNLMIGPSAEYIDDGEDYASTRRIMDKLFAEAKQLLPTIERRHIIGSFCGIRAKQAPPSEGGFHDFVICEKPRNMVQLIGIESPGLTASAPIARRVAAMIAGKTQPKADFDPIHRFKPRFRDLPREEQQKLIEQDPDYGEIVCRCEQVTRREIRDAIENPLGARTVSSIKYRTAATMGRCQGGYCLSRIARMLIEEYGMKPEEVTLRGEGSPLFEGYLREEAHE
ncbi:MAG: FAD-dependent oxidoreductase, partial [Clostridia bacterium]|nr:FAD-dependent oxidoreductase [Clostridia bacterium]